MIAVSDHLRTCSMVQFSVSGGRIAERWSISIRRIERHRADAQGKQPVAIS
jgi:hypothetical protein